MNFTHYKYKKKFVNWNIIESGANVRGTFKVPRTYLPVNNLKRLKK